MIMLLNCLNINKHTINLEPGKQPLYKLIYSLSLAELKIFKIYIKANLANSFIQPFKSFIKVYIFLSKSLTKVFIYI